jgi:CHAD domain-containing protein
MIQVFDAVVEKYQAGVKKESLAGIRRGLEESKQSADPERAISSALAGLDAVRGRVKGWPIEGDEFRVLADGLEASYRAGRKALNRAEKNGIAKNYHDFRKRVKEHWYHMRLIESWWTEPLESRTASLKDLETFLGEHHNLAVLEEKLAIEPGTQLFLALAANEQRELERNSISLGQRLYEQKPKQFVRGLSKLFEVATPRKRPARADQAVIARERPA